MEMDGLISVIIPVYNVENYLDACLESVCAQTYVDLEIILVDDGSTDRSGALCDSWAKRDHRIRVIHKPNGGVSSARNAGIAASSGDRLGFIDADDRIEPNMYEKLDACLKANEADVAMCGYVDYPYGIGAPVYKGIEPVVPGGFEASLVQIYRRDGYSTSMWNKLYRRDLVFVGDGVHSLDESLSVGEDELWLVEVLSRSRRAAYVPEPLYYWLPRENSAIRSRQVTPQRMTVLESKRRALQFMPEGAAPLARAVMYNDCYYLKVDAYCMGERDQYRAITRAIRPMRWDWLQSANCSFMRKLKVMLLGVEMALRLPKRLVDRTNSMTNNNLAGR